MQVVNSDADLLSRHASQMASRFHHTTKILLTASPVWTQMTTAVDRAAVGQVLASTHGLLRNVSERTTPEAPYAKREQVVSSNRCIGSILLGAFRAVLI